MDAGPRPSKRRVTITCIAAVVCLLLSSCSGPPRNALPEHLVPSARIPGIEHAYSWGDQSPVELEKHQREAQDMINRLVVEKGEAFLEQPLNYLALSGGGHSGAFGAGILKGWSQAGTRPQFTLVTGISTGAIIAPFAFLGPDYDDELREIYTQYRTRDAIEFRSILGALLGDSAADASGLQALIAEYIDADVMQAIAEEHNDGRALFIGTTNLDAGRPVSWNIGRIAASGAPNALSLIQDIIQASVSIPGVFPPVMIEYEAGGVRYQEMHVDGGVTRQVFLFPGELRYQRLLDELGVTGSQHLYIVFNGTLEQKREIVDTSIFAISARSIRTLTKNQGIGDLYRMYLFARKNDIGYRLTSIPQNFSEEPREMFDREYMRALFDLGVERGRQPDLWQHKPPEFQTANQADID